MNFSLGASIVLHHHRSRSVRRLTLALMIAGMPLPAFAADSNELQLRAPMQSRLQIRSAQKSWIKPEQTRKATPANTARPRIASRDALQREAKSARPFNSINDGWVAREAINQITPLRDPVAKRKQTVAGEAAAESGLDAVANQPGHPSNRAGETPQVASDAVTLSPPAKSDPVPEIAETPETEKAEANVAGQDAASGKEAVPGKRPEHRLAEKPQTKQQTQPKPSSEASSEMTLTPADPPSLGAVGESAWQPRIAARAPLAGLDPAKTLPKAEDQRSVVEEPAQPQQKKHAVDTDSLDTEAASEEARSPQKDADTDNESSALSSEAPLTLAEEDRVTSESGILEDSSDDAPVTAHLGDVPSHGESSSSGSRPQPSVSSDEEAHDRPAAAERQEVEAKSGEEAEAKSKDKIVVRPLRIMRDGRIAGEDLEQDEKPAKRQPAIASRPESSLGTRVERRQSANPVAEKVVLDYSGTPAEPIDVSSAVGKMQPMMRRCLQYYYNRPETASGRSNWGMLHAIMVYGVDTKILARRQSYSAIAWIAGNNICRGKRLFTKGPSGIEATDGVGLQGHQGQFLAVMGLVGVPSDYPLYVGREKFSIEDLIRAEKRQCKQGEELTFTLIGLSHYLSTDDAWTDARGERWDFERLIREELAQPVIGAACGGTHRLMGLAHALRNRRAEGLPLTGQWARAEKFLDDFVDYTYSLQNRDGSMSTNWFEGRGDEDDLDRKIQTTGHMVEWLLTVTPDSELQNPRLVRAIQFLLRSMYRQRNRDWAIGPKGHALRSLAMYYERVYGDGTAWEERTVAHSRSAGRR